MLGRNAQPNPAVQSSIARYPATPNGIPRVLSFSVSRSDLHCTVVPRQTDSLDLGRPSGGGGGKYDCENRDVFQEYSTKNYRLFFCPAIRLTKTVVPSNGRPVISVSTVIEY